VPEEHAGFGLYPDNVIGFVADPLICLSIAAVVILACMSFPVIFELCTEVGNRGLIRERSDYGDRVLGLG
jgi:Trk-type K+ transport system membrane component